MKLIAIIPFKIKSPNGQVEELKPGEAFQPVSPDAVKRLIAKGKARLEKCVSCERDWCLIKTDESWVQECAGAFGEGEIHRFPKKKRGGRGNG